jgi:hypothetical protein
MARSLEGREVLFDRAGDSRITGIGEQTERMPQAEGGLERAGAQVHWPGYLARQPPSVTRVWPVM